MTESSIYGSTRELMTATDAIEKASGDVTFKRRSLLSRQRSCQSFEMGSRKIDQVLTPEEKRFLLFVERGDCASAARTIKSYKSKPYLFDINCTDPLGRSSLSIAIINENPEMMELLLEESIQVKDALLLAISEEYVEGVELLLQHEERNHEPGQPYSWEAVDYVSANYTPDITPLILAAHKNNYEILKILLDRGASLPAPHDLKCSCEACITASQEDSLRFSLSRINAYRALASPSLIALTSSDPILTAFQLSDELKKLKQMESQFSAHYSEMRKQVQDFATSLLDHARTSYELEIMLNYSMAGEIWDPGETQTLERLKLALKCKQKAFVAHPNVQQLLATIWYEGLPGWRRMNIISQALELVRLGLMFPVYCIAYMIAPSSSSGHFLKNPFVKFICHSASFLCFLMLLACASQRLEQLTMQVVGEMFEIQYLLDLVEEWQKHERGALPSPIECVIIFWVMSLIWKEVKEVYEVGLVNYMKELWNLADVFTNTCFIGWILLRITAWIIVKREESAGINPYYPREQWHAYDPFLISEGLFGAGMISSFLKLVHIFSINPHLGPLQISLGRMTVDILKWLVLYLLVLFAFGCGMNQLLWYYADLEYDKCYSLPGGLPNVEGEVTTRQAMKSNACIVWRRFANLFETSQSLFWASFGLVSLTDFELTGIKEFTRFWALLMFGSYSVCNIIVLLNMLIAMMSNSFQLISQKSDTEWKFSRTKLWMSYFETGSTVPPPFNIIPTPKYFCRGVGCMKADQPNKNKEREVAVKRYRDVMKCIIRRYVTAEQKKTEEFSITEDDVSEIRQDINKFRYELIDILRSNNFNTPDIRNSDVYVSNKRAKQTQRRILKGFNISTVDIAIREAFAKDGEKSDFFKTIAKAISNKSGKKPSDGKDNNDMIDPIGSTRNLADTRMANFRRTILARGGSEDELHKLSADELVHFNPILKNYTPTTRLAYAKFKSFVAKDLKVASDSKDKFGEETETSKRITPTISRLSSFVEKKTSSLQGSLNDSLSNLAIKEELEMEKSPVKESAVPQQLLASVLDKKLVQLTPYTGSNVMQMEEKVCEKNQTEKSSNYPGNPSSASTSSKEKNGISAEKQPELPTNSVKLLTKQFSQEVPEGGMDAPNPIISKGPKAKIAIEIPRKIEEHQSSPPKNGARKKKVGVVATKPASQARVFPESGERAFLGIQSPLNSPVMEPKEPPSPLPPRNVPLSMDTLIPFVDESCSPVEKIVTNVSPETTKPSPLNSPKIEEKQPESKSHLNSQPKVEPSDDDEGKSVITGQILSGWL